MKIRIKFEKKGALKFVGHLDIMRYFQRAIRRADIDIALTEGFSPHPIMSFALPLGVGTESEGEYFDIRVNSSDSSESSINALNRQMAEGIRILSYKKLPDDSKVAMSLVAAADYILTPRAGYVLPDNFEKKLFQFYGQDKILIVKHTKKNDRELDLKPLIFDMNIVDGKIFMSLSAGSVENIKPQLLMEALYAYIGCELPPFAFSILRKELYMHDKNGSLIPLDKCGEDIK